MPCNPGDGRKPLVGYENYLNIATFCFFSQSQQTILISANIENHQNVASAHIEKARHPDTFPARQVINTWPNDRHMPRHILRYRIGKATSNQVDVAFCSTQRGHNLAQLLLA